MSHKHRRKRKANKHYNLSKYECLSFIEMNAVTLGNASKTLWFVKDCEAKKKNQRFHVVMTIPFY